jgi:hypothetical protein
MRILLVSPDLMSTSRIAALGRPIGAQVETLRSLDLQPQGGPYALVLVDLQSLTGDAAVILSRVRTILTACAAQGDEPMRIVAFGPHVHKQRLDDSKAAGALAAVSRGELLGGFAGLVARWVG